MEWPTFLKSQIVTAGNTAATITLQYQTREVIVINITGNAAYVRTLQLGGTAAASSGSLYIPAVAGAERTIVCGVGETLSYIRGGESDTSLEITEVG